MRCNTRCAIGCSMISQCPPAALGNIGIAIHARCAGRSPGALRASTTSHSPIERVSTEVLEVGRVEPIEAAGGLDAERACSATELGWSRSLQ
eukprot:5011103-Pyramimonas_sp.AAC.1